MKFKAILVLIIFISGYAEAISKDPPTEKMFYTGVFGDANLNYHYADFRSLPGYPNCCQGYEYGLGMGFEAGLFFELPVTYNFGIQLRGAYTDNSALLSWREKTTFGIEGVDYDGEIDHTIDADLRYIKIEPLISLKLSDHIKLLFGGGYSYALNHKFTQKEAIKSPDNALFENGLKSRNVFENEELPDINENAASLDAGLTYYLPLNKNGSLILAPELMLSYRLTPVVKNKNWQDHSAKLGASLIFAPSHPEPALEAAPPPMPELPEPPPYISTSIEAKGISENKETEVLPLKVEEFIAKKTTPLLNYVFFDQNAHELPERYKILDKKKAGNFSESHLKEQTTLEVYHNILNILGFRMKNNPQSQLLVRGCNSNRGLEKGNIKLSEKRSETITKYLTNAWEIDPGRIKTETVNLPENYSRYDVDLQDGIKENRRAEIESINGELLKPLTIRDTIRKIDPPALRFYMSTRSQNQISSWKVTISQQDKIIKEIKGEGDVPNSVDWQVTETEAWQLRGNSRLEYALQVTDIDGNTNMEQKKEIPLELITLQKKLVEKTKDKIIDKFQLILFGYDEAEITTSNKKIIDDIIRKSIKPESEIRITGYSDRKGDTYHNKTLSEDRAQNTKSYLNHPQTLECRGVGESNLYDNDLPEGRFYSRTVVIEAVTPK